MREKGGAAKDFEIRPSASGVRRWGNNDFRIDVFDNETLSGRDCVNAVRLPELETRTARGVSGECEMNRLIRRPVRIADRDPI
jgi:hypothetical protein